MPIQLQNRTLTTKVILNKQRAAKLVPGVIYGPKFDNKNFFIDEHVVISEMRKGNFYHKILECELNGEKINVIPLSVSSHPVTDSVTHLDFKHVSKDSIIEIKVSIKAINEDKNFDLQNGAYIEYKKHFVTLQGKSASIPTEVTFDVSSFKVGHKMLAKDLLTDKSVTLLTNLNDVLIEIAGKVRTI